MRNRKFVKTILNIIVMITEKQIKRLVKLDNSY